MFSDSGHYLSAAAPPLKTSQLEQFPARLNAILERVANNDVEIKVDAIDERMPIDSTQKTANHHDGLYSGGLDRRRGDVNGRDDLVQDFRLSGFGDVSIRYGRRRRSGVGHQHSAQRHQSAKKIILPINFQRLSSKSLAFRT